MIQARTKPIRKSWWKSYRTRLLHVIQTQEEGADSAGSPVWTSNAEGSVPGGWTSEIKFPSRNLQCPGLEGESIYHFQWAYSLLLLGIVKEEWTEGLFRIKQVIEIFYLALKGIILPPNIFRHIIIMEQDGAVPLKIVQVCCTVNKKGNKKAMDLFHSVCIQLSCLETWSGKCLWPTPLTASRVSRGLQK